MFFLFFVLHFALFSVGLCVCLWDEKTIDSTCAEVKEVAIFTVFIFLICIILLFIIYERNMK
jgi:hypothetical protein